MIYSQTSQAMCSAPTSADLLAVFSGQVSYGFRARSSSRFRGAIPLSVTASLLNSCLLSPRMSSITTMKTLKTKWARNSQSCRSDRHDAWTFFEKEPVPDPLPAVKAAAETSKELIRPSLCLQIREGRLHVFLPYISAASDYLELVSAVEDTCASICKCRCGSKVIHHRLICAYDQLQPNPRPRGS